MKTHALLQRLFEQIDGTLTVWMARYGLTLLRVAIGIIFVWFGVLKFIGGASPAEGLIRATLPFLPMVIFLPLLAVWEVLIGIGFLSGRFTRLTILLLFLQMPGTFSPVLLRPDLVFTAFPFALTLEGQYIVKNLVIIGAALVIGATVRGGYLVAQKPAEA